MQATDLPRWKHPADYGGFSPDGDYYIYSQNRDSSALERSNYARIFEHLQAKAESLDVPDAVYDWRAGHWAGGWIEHMCMSAAAPDALVAELAEILAALADYPVFDEGHFSALEFTEACEFWERMSIRERAELCRDADVSIFAARRDSLPDSDYIYEYLRD